MRLSLLAAASLSFLSVGVFAGIASAKDAALTAAIADPNRTPRFVARDTARHPAEELEFFGIKPTMTVVEIWPEGGYWTEILAPYLHDRGTYYIADPLPNYMAPTKAMLDKNAALYGNVKVSAFGKGTGDIAPPDSADLIVTFRNLHNFMHSGYADETFPAFYKALKPGGILGIEEHRGRSDVPQDPKATSGYVRQDYAVRLAEAAGFKLVGSSEINANPKDTKDWPAGVWTLPPVLTLKDKDRDKYLAIGEADNFVLKFQKPAK